MAVMLRDIAVDWGVGEESLPARAAAAINLPVEALSAFKILRCALDARRKGRPQQVYTVSFVVADEAALLRRQAGNPRLQQLVEAELPQPLAVGGQRRVLVVGMGPAGLFAALRLAGCGFAVTLLERGRPVEQRVRDVERFWRDGTLVAESNVQFGEGGAGTFSDGKLSTRINHPWLRYVLATLVACGARDDLLVNAKPHIGSDRLRLVLIRFRQRLQALGVALHYGARLSGLELHGGRVVGGVVNDRDLHPCAALVLATGHSARDTYRMLAGHGVALERKDFAVGLRVEHPRTLIDRLQYGAGHPADLPAADYALRHTDAESGRGVYSFCMCPGGEVINSMSSPGELVVNGMSNSRRSGSFSNSALVVSVGAADAPESGLFGGLALQARLEAAAFGAGGGGGLAPAQNLLAFAGKGRGPLLSTCRPGVREADLGALLPPPVTAALRRALPHFDRQMRGFLTGEAVLVGVETRTSAPLRIVRDERGVSRSHPGLYPAGEGAGYAGGIMSAALDGLRAAEAIIQQVEEGSLA